MELLEEFEEDEEEEPEQAHGVPVPDGTVDDDLAGGDLAGAADGDESEDDTDSAKFGIV